MELKSVSRLQLEVLCDHLSDTAVCFLDPQGRVCDWNSGAARFFRIQDAEIMGHKASELFAQAPWEAALREAGEAGIYSGEWNLRDLQTSDKRIFVELRRVASEGSVSGYSLLCRNLQNNQAVGSEDIRSLPIGTQQQLFEQLVAHSYSGVTLFNAQYKIIYRSPSSARITGFSNDDRSRTGINDMIHPADSAAVMDLLEALLQCPGESRTCEFRSFHKSGHYIHLECVFTNWLQESAIQAIVLNFRDISEKKKSDEYLQQAMQELSAYKYALDEAAIVAVTDREGKITHVNDYFCRISGYSREELIGRDHRLINSGYHDRSYIADLWQTITQGDVWRGELCNRNKDGSLYWVATTIVPFFGEDHRPYRYMAIRFDVSAAKDAEIKLRRSSDQISSLLEEVSDGFLALDENGVYTYVNPRICQMLDMQAEQMIGRYIWDLFPDAVGSATYQAIEKARTDGIPVVNEDYYAPLDLWQENRIYPGAHGLSIFISDISKRKRQEQEQLILLELTEALQVHEDMQDALKVVLEKLMKFSHAALVEVWLNSADRELLYLERNLGNTAEIMEAFDPEKNIRQMPIGKGLAGSVWLQGTYTEWDNLAAHPDFLRREAARKSGITKAMGIPLTDGGENYGVLILGFTQEFPKMLHEELRKQLGANLGAAVRRKRMKQELQQIFEFVPDVICTIGDDRRYKHVNPTMCALFEYTEEELLRMKIDDLIHPDELESSHARTKNFRKAGEQTMYFENRYVSKSGKLIHMSWSVRKALEKGTLFCVGKNITEQKELEELLRKASELARIGSWELHPQSGEVYWSPLTKELLEVDAAFQMDWEKAPDFCPPTALQDINGAIERVIRDGGNFDVEIEVQTGEKHARWVRILGQGEFLNGQCTRVYGSVQDVSVRKIQELQLQAQAEALSASEKRYSELFHMSPLPMWVFDLETLAFLDVNEAAITQYGYSREEFMKMSIRDIRPAAEQEKLTQVLENVARLEYQYRPGIFTHLRKNGEIIDVEIVSSALHFQERPARLALMFDVTERNRYLAEIEDQNKRLRDISWQQSHVVRAPLSRIMALIQLLKDLPAHAPEQDEILQHIRNSADELDQVIRDITAKAVAQST